MMKKAFKNSGFKAPRSHNSSKESSDAENLTSSGQIKVEREELDADTVPNPFVPDASDGEDNKENIASAPADNVKKSKIKHTNAAKERKADQKKLVRSLTDEEYEEIFTAALSIILPVEEDDQETINKPPLCADDEASREPYAGIYDFGEEPKSVDQEKNHNADGDFDEMDLENMPEDIKAEVTTFNRVESPVHASQIIGTLTPIKSKPSQKKEQTSTSKKRSLEPKQPVSSKQVKRPSFGVNTKMNAVAKEPNLLKETKVTNQPSAEMKKSKNKFERREKMKERKIVETGTWVQCTKKNCLKWRFLAELHDPATLPEIWTCAMNPDFLHNSCEIPEEKFDENQHNLEYVFTRFTEGSLVWARMAGYPWWPAMVEIDPDFENYFECRGFDNVASHYHVVFFDDRVSRAWISSTNLIPFTGSERNKELFVTRTKHGDFKKGINEAREKALEAQDMAIKDRLKTFSFAKRYKGKWGKTSDGSQEMGTSTKNGKKRLHKTKERRSMTKSPSIRKPRELDVLPDDVDILQSQSEEDLFSSAEALLKDAEDVLSEFFSSQHEDDASEYEESTPAKKPKTKPKRNKSAIGESAPKKQNSLSNNNEITKPVLDPDVFAMDLKVPSDKQTPSNNDQVTKPAFDPDVFTMDTNTQADQQTPKVTKKSKSSKKSKSKKDDRPSKNKTVDNVVKSHFSKKTEKKFHTVPMKKTAAENANKTVENDNKTGSSNDKIQLRSSQTDKNVTTSQASSQSTKADENNNDQLSQQSAMNTKSEHAREKITSPSHNMRKKSKKFSAPVVKKSTTQKSQDEPESIEATASTKQEVTASTKQEATASIKQESIISTKQTTTNTKPLKAESATKRILRSSQSQPDESDDMELDLNIVGPAKEQSQNSASSQDLDLSQVLVDDPIKSQTLSQTGDVDSEPLDFEE